MVEENASTVLGISNLWLVLLGPCRLQLRKGDVRARPLAFAIASHEPNCR